MDGVAHVKMLVEGAVITAFGKGLTVIVRVAVVAQSPVVGVKV